MNHVTTCPYCGETFTLDELLASPDIVPIGMKLDDDEAEWNFYFFNHVAEHCGTTFTVRVERFEHLLAEVVPPAIRTGACECEGRCTSLEDLAACGAECHWAPYRRFLKVLLARKIPSNR